MRELRQSVAERRVQLHLARRVRKVVVAANHVGNLHPRVVHHAREIVRGIAVRLADDEVVEVVVVKVEFPAHHVEKPRGPGLAPEAHHVRRSARHAPLHLVARKPQATAVVFGCAARFEFFAAQRFEFLGRAVASVRAAALEQPLRFGGVHHRARRLHIRAVLALPTGAFVPVEPEPLHRIEDRFARFTRGPFGVGVFNTQNEGSAGLARVEPVEQRRTRTADVQVARRTRRKPHPDRPGVHGDSLSVHVAASFTISFQPAPRLRRDASSSERPAPRSRTSAARPARPPRATRRRHIRNAL